MDCTNSDASRSVAHHFGRVGDVEHPRDNQYVTAHLTLFRSEAYRLTVLDLGADTETRRATLPEALRKAGLVVGVNGGFFPSRLAFTRIDDR